MAYQVTELEDAFIDRKERLENVLFQQSPDHRHPHYKGASVQSSLMLLLDCDNANVEERFLVVVSQRVKESSKHFVLYGSGTFSPEERDVFVRIFETLSPLLSSSTTAADLSKSILEVIILPEPLPPQLVSSRVVALLEDNSDEAVASSDQMIKALVENKKFRVSSAQKQNIRTRLMLTKLRHTGVLNSMVLLPLLIGAPNQVLKIFETDSTNAEKIFSLNKRRILRRYSTEYFALHCKTMLMEAVENEFVQSCMYMTLTAGIDLNEKEPCLGNTALHLAVQKSNLDIVKLLLAFHADPTACNKENETPLDLANRSGGSKSREIANVLTKMINLQAKERAYNDNHRCVPEKRNSSDVFLLSLDGGGLKVYNSCKTLMNIEKRMKELSPDCAPLQSYFDFFAGTSAGGTIAATLLYENEPVENIAIALHKFMHQVVKKPIEHRIEYLKSYLFDHFGEDTVLSDLREDKKIMVTTTMADISPYELHIMSSYGEPRDGKLGPNKRKVWEALAATMAAPMYLPPLNNCFIDGGLVANNPTLTALSEFFEYKKPEQKLGCVLSVGTGYLPTKCLGRVEMPSSFSVSSVIHALPSLKNLVAHFVTQSVRSDGEIVRHARSWCESLGVSYFRLNTQLSENISMDSTSLSDIITQFFDSEVYLLTHHETVDGIAKKLLSK